MLYFQSNGSHLRSSKGLLSAEEPFKQWVTSREAGNALALLGVLAQLSLMICRAGGESANTGADVCPCMRLLLLTRDNKQSQMLLGKDCRNGVATLLQLSFLGGDLLSVV